MRDNEEGKTMTSTTHCWVEGELVSSTPCVGCGAEVLFPHGRSRLSCTKCKAEKVRLTARLRRCPTCAPSLEKLYETILTAAQDEWRKSHGGCVVGYGAAHFRNFLGYLRTHPCEHDEAPRKCESCSEQ